MLKFGKGEDLLKIIKKKKEIPVMVITAKYQLKDKEKCFQLGADDYLVKPFEPKEMVLRINNLIKLYSKMDSKYLLDEITIDFEAHKIINNKKEYYITKKESDLLFVLLKNRGKVVNNEAIMSYVWGDSIVGTDSIRAYIMKLRKMIGEDKIKTVKGIGYLIK
jgi:DNA-binding response OmpR family regulator